MTTALILRPQTDLLPSEFLPDWYTHQFDSFLAPLRAELLHPQPVNRRWLEGKEANILQIIDSFRQQIPYLTTLPADKRANTPLTFWSEKGCIQIKAGAIPSYLDDLYRTLKKNQEREEDWTLVSRAETLDQVAERSMLRQLWELGLSLPQSFLARHQSAEQQFLRKVEAMKRQTYKHEDPGFQADLVKPYKKGTTWNPSKLRRQIIADLPRLSLSIDGQPVLNFNAICQTFGISEEVFKETEYESSADIDEKLKWMAMLHQGASAKGLELASAALNGNAANLWVGERTSERREGLSEEERTYATRLELYQDRPSLYVEQDLELRDPAARQAGYPILTKTFWEKGQPAKVQWGLV